MQRQATALAEERDTEITLGTGKLLLMFFGAVVVCGVFFGLGFNLGRASAPQPDPNVVATAPLTPAPGAPKPAATRPLAPAPAVVTEPLQTAGVQNPGTVVPPPQPAQPAPELKPVAGTPEMNSSSGFVVQVAAVTHKEDAEALSQALQQKKYPVFVVSDLPDKLYHVQLGPFGERKDALAMRDRLAGEGYNPIVK